VFHPIEPTTLEPNTRARSQIMNCCEQLFDDFQFADLRTANPPKQKSLYVIRVKQKGLAPSKIIREVKLVTNKLGWSIVEDFVDSRMSHLSRIDNCPLIYIGANRDKGENTISDRYKEIANRHTIMHPLWALIYFDWDFDFGWKVNSKPESFEKLYKQKYRALHGGRPPALVEK
jgi:hypothetical protein